MTSDRKDSAVNILNQWDSFLPDISVSILKKNMLNFDMAYSRMPVHKNLTMVSNNVRIFKVKWTSSLEEYGLI